MEIKKEVLKRALQRVVGMARGVVVVDENIENIVESLEKKNIRVYAPPKGLDDFSKEFERLIAGRIFVTANPKDFLKRAPELDTGIISVERVYKKKLPDHLSDDISDVIRQLKLFSKRHGFLVTIKSDDVEYEEFD